MFVVKHAKYEKATVSDDKLFDDIRWVTTLIYRASCALINGFWRLICLMMLLVVAVLTLSLYVAPAMLW